MPIDQLQICLVPLDERPVNTRYPQMLGEIGGAQIVLPDVSILGKQREPADLDEVSAWLAGQSRTAAAALVSCDFLAFGNLINARISNSSAAEALSRLEVLSEVNSRCPVHAFSLITRVANADNAIEEPEYWADWGTKFYAYSRLASESEQRTIDSDGQAQLDNLARALPQNELSDWLRRRLRNHVVNLGLMDLAAHGQITSLLITSDDTSPVGMPSLERAWLGYWPRQIGPMLSDNMMMHPGADEVGSALVARIVNEHHSARPRIYTLWSISGDEQIVAPYEDKPIRQTVAGQIHACGCDETTSVEDADIILGVVTPSPRRRDFHVSFLEQDRIDRLPFYRRFLDDLAEFKKQGLPIAIADVAYPNGADPVLFEALLSPEAPLKGRDLCAYGGWNTAGNTLGVVVAQAACSLYAAVDPVRTVAQGRFLAHRFLEDYGYQANVRREARAYCSERFGRSDPDPTDEDQQRAVCSFIEGRLTEVLTDLCSRGVCPNASLIPGSTRLPWQRTFEVDFTLR